MTRTTREQKAVALEAWASAVDGDALTVVETGALKQLARLAQARAALESDVEAAVWEARAAKRSWSEIGAMLGVSKQAAQRRYGRRSRVA